MQSYTSNKLGRQVIERSVSQVVCLVSYGFCFEISSRSLRLKKQITREEAEEKKRTKPQKKRHNNNFRHNNERHSCWSWETEGHVYPTDRRRCICIFSSTSLSMKKRRTTTTTETTDRMKERLEETERSSGPLPLVVNEGDEEDEYSVCLSVTSIFGVSRILFFVIRHLFLLRLHLLTASVFQLREKKKKQQQKFLLIDSKRINRYFFHVRR